MGTEYPTGLEITHGKDERNQKSGIQVKVFLSTTVYISNHLFRIFLSKCPVLLIPFIIGFWFK